jgi:hypothetical protein
MPSGGKLSIYDNTNADALGLRANVIEVQDFSGNNYPDNALSFRFKGNSSADLLTLKHHVAPLNKSPSYNSSSNNVPHAELRGDLRLLGSLRFSDGTSLDSSSQISTLSTGLTDANSQISAINSSLSALFVEGTASRDIPPPLYPSSPTSGNLILRDSSWHDVGSRNLINRDKALHIHAGNYVIAIRINNEYRPIWVSDQDPSCTSCVRN